MQSHAGFQQMHMLVTVNTPWDLYVALKPERNTLRLPLQPQNDC